jgi:hypothetical protein
MRHLRGVIDPAEIITATHALSSFILTRQKPKLLDKTAKR